MSARRCAVVLIVVAVALGACAKKAPRTQHGSPSPSTATAAASVSAGLPASGLPPARPSSSVTCAIVTVAEVNAALGTAVTARHLDTNPPATVCTYAGGTPS